MNKRIQQLADKAGWIYEGNSRVPDMEKFAELLVLECINSVMDGTKEGDHYAMRIEHHFDNGPGGILHFRVE